MVKCGDAGLQFRVSGVRVRVNVWDRVGVMVSTFLLFVTLAAHRSPHPRMPAFYP